MKGQASIEVVFMVAVVTILTIFVLSKFTGTQDGVFTVAAARQEILGEIEKMNTKFVLNSVTAIQCTTGIKVNVSIFPTPTAAEQTQITGQVAPTIMAASNTQSVTVLYNSTLTC